MNAFNLECLINKPTCLQSENPSCIYLLKLKNYYRIKELFRHSRRSRSSRSEVFLEKGVLKICSTFTAEHPCRSAISIKLLCNFIEIVLGHGCPPVNLMHIFRTPFSRNTSGRLLLKESLIVIALL